MKKIYFGFFLLLTFNFAAAQLAFEERFVYGEVSYNETVLSADITGNGHMDIVYSTRYAASGDSVKMVINTDGNGGFNPPQYISTIDWASEIHAADLDNDGDLDIISANLLSDRVVWHRNDFNGLLYFNSGTENLITTSGNGPTSVYAADLDGDNDMDLLVASTYDDTVAWYENTDGFGNFGPEQVITFIADAPSDVQSADIDGDGDMDVVVASQVDDSIRWFRNTDGLGNFALAQTVTTFADVPDAIDIADIDNDGDLDILSASRIDDKVAWYENLNGNGVFGDQQVIDTSIDFVKEVLAADLDNDGDLDVVASSGSYGGSNPQNEISWFENTDGQGTFGTKQPVSGLGNGAHSAVARDINEDGLLDIVYVVSDDLGWYENLGIQRNEITGNIGLDTNLSACNSQSSPIPNVFLTATNGVDSLTTMSLNNGLYQLFPDIGNYTTTISSQIPPYFNTFPPSHSSSFSGYGETDTADFCFQASGIVDDLSVSMYPLFSDPRPGFNNTYQLVFRNNGNTQLSGNVSIAFDDSKIQYLTSNETMFQDGPNILNHFFDDLNPFEIRKINVEFYVFPIPTTNIDDILSFTTTINPITGDETVNDNVFSFDNLVIGAYDPNDITVLEGDEVHIDDADEYLHYLIRFQNTGTAAAINVNVENRLDDKLDWTTMQLLSLSHPGRVELTDSSLLNFIFDDINLPDSTNDEPNSHGYIVYRIKPIDNIQLGDVVSNKADIYFDFNPPIITNTVTTEYVDQLSVSEFDKDEFSVFPNPTSGLLNIKGNSRINSVTIFDINGRQLISMDFKEPELQGQIDISNLTSGVYFLTITSNRGENNIKIVKN